MKIRKRYVIICDTLHFKIILNACENKILFSHLNQPFILMMMLEPHHQVKEGLVGQSSLRNFCVVPVKSPLGILNPTCLQSPESSRRWWLQADSSAGVSTRAPVISNLEVSGQLHSLHGSWIIPGQSCGGKCWPAPRSFLTASAGMQYDFCCMLFKVPVSKARPESASRGHRWLQQYYTVFRPSLRSLDLSL